MEKIQINNNWKFIDESQSYEVSVPHSVKLESLDVYKNYQGTFTYIRDLADVLSHKKDSKVFIEFEGVMTNAKVYYNDKMISEHFGGYLPIYVEITDYISSLNILKVEVSNYDDPNTPPGKKTSGLDFLYYGGIYRDVNIYFKPNIYITSAVENYKNGGGIKLECYKNLNNYYLSATVSIRNSSSSAAQKPVVLSVYNGDVLVNTITKDVKLKASRTTVVELKTECANIIEWHVDNPFRYKIIVSVGEYFEQLMYGFRTVTVDKNGFNLNGQVIKLFGVNRHSQYPFIGISASSEAERREARMLKETGINTLRLAHYPQSSAFLDECDKIGLLVIDCVPGWQYKGGKIWRERLLQNVREMIRRDRNLACVAIYEVTPNETNWATKRGDNFYKLLHNTAKAELANCITSGDTSGRRNAEFIGFDIPYSGTDKLSRRRPLYPNGEKKFLKREYGDWGFGGNKSTSRVALEDGEYAMTVQAFNFQWDRNYAYTTENILGDLIWEGIDHNRGYYPDSPISKSGIFDVFRRRKFSYYWLKSQCSPLNGYTLFPALNECVGNKDFLVYSNCKSVAIVIDGKEIIRKFADNGETHSFNRSGKTAVEDNYWALGTDHISISKKDCPLARHTKMCLFQGGDCEKLKYPPFTFLKQDFDGKNISFLGYDEKGNQVACLQKTAYSQAVRLDIQINDNGIKLKTDGNDFVWLTINAVDKNGQVDYKFNKNIKITVDGGDTIYSNELPAEAGIAVFMLRATKSKLSITASCNDFIISKDFLLQT